MSETILVTGKPVLDRYGDLVTPSEAREIPGCVIGLRGQADINGGGVWDGDATILEVLAPGGTEIREGDTVTFRGEAYVVTNVPFDWSVGRRPVNPRHRPRTRFLIEKREA